MKIDPRTSPRNASALAALGVALAGAAFLHGCSCGAEGSIGGGGATTCTSDRECESGSCVDGRCARRDAGAPSTGCRVDEDGDGYGRGCSRGPDCDDGDPNQTGVEVCDGRDNDCNDVVDDGAMGECGDCDPTCRSGGTGVGQPMGFDVMMDESEGVGLDPSGAIVLDSSRVDTAFIWIANTGEGTVSKFDTRTFVEVARYRTGPMGPADDPSRTSINSEGDAYVGNRGGDERGGRSVTKISVLGDQCPDTNGDGVITTSHGPTEILPWGQDDCVLWNTPLNGGRVRAVAAQDVIGPDGEVTPFVWAGGWDGWVFKLDGRTGAVLVRTAAPVNTYGFALDGRGNLWIAGRNDNALGRIDTARCLDNTCGGMVCGPTDDTCVKQQIPLGANPYGITVDYMQRVWTANHGTESVTRYDPMAAAATRITRQDIGVNCHGIAADGTGSVWCAGAAAGVVRVDATNPAMFLVVPGTAGMNAKGMAVDFDGKIWAIHRTGADGATVITPGAALNLNTVRNNVATSIVSPYTYSDMTGQQLRLATNPRGYYRHVYEGCPASAGVTATTEWLELRWTGETPPGTRMRFRARTAATRADLANLMDDDWVLIAETPPATSPVSIRDALRAASVMPGAVLQIEAQLVAERTSSAEIITPRLQSIQVTHSCVGGIM